ncbi:TPA: hypothetical protein DD455_03050 [Candidatus Shapirobacteria bacterium]|nr:hypothetical protein [Candidatus Shapirobacteria bacterium]
MKIENLWIIDDDFAIANSFKLEAEMEGIEVDISGMCQKAVKNIPKNLRRKNLVILLDHNLTDNRQGGELIARKMSEELIKHPELTKPVIFSVSYGNYDISYCPRRFLYHDGIDDLISRVDRISNMPSTR